MTPTEGTTRSEPEVKTTVSPLARSSDVHARDISHSYGAVEVLHDVDLMAHHGEFLTLLGPSGSGKSTLLRMIGGLETPSVGSVSIGDQEVTALPPERRDVGVVFQNYALFPHMTVAENVAFPLRMRKVKKQESRERVQKMLELVELGDMGARRPGELSGGQQQRVALARALVFEPRVLLLDEPFGALDRRLRESLGLAVRRLQRDLGITTIFVTHDQDEAFTMSTRIAVISDGRILQVDAPGEVYRAPQTLQAARMLGQLNEFDVRVDSVDAGGVHVTGEAGLRFAVELASTVTVGTHLRCGVRPEHIRVAADEDESCHAPAVVLAGIFGGNWKRAQLDIGTGTDLMAALPLEATALEDGDSVFCGFDRVNGLLFDAESGERIG